MNIIEIKPTIPDGYEIDKENSTFECIRLKPIEKVLSYEDIAKKLFYNKTVIFINAIGDILENNIQESNISEPNNCTSEKQAEKLIAINKLMNVAKYLNDGWIPNWDNDELKWFIEYNSKTKLFTFSATTYKNNSFVYFRTSKLAEQAFDILGKEIIELALSTDW